MNVIPGNHPALEPVHKARAERSKQQQALADLAHRPVTEEELRHRLAGDLDTQMHWHDPASAVQDYTRADGLPRKLDLSTPTMILALMGRERVLDSLVEIARQGGWDPDNAITSEQRTKQAKTLTTKLAKLAETEERAIVAIEADGHLVPRREDVDPPMLFAIWDEMCEGGARKKLRELVRAGDAMHRMLLGLSDEYTETVAKLQKKRQELKRLEDAYRNAREVWSGISSEEKSFSQRQVERCRKEIADLEEQQQELVTERDRRAAEWQSFIAPVRRLMEYTGHRQGEVNLEGVPARADLPPAPFGGSDATASPGAAAARNNPGRAN